MSVRTYNPSVRVGNWNEDIQLEEDTLKEFLQRRESGDLLYQKRTKLEQTIFKKLYCHGKCTCPFCSRVSLTSTEQKCGTRRKC